MFPCQAVFIDDWIPLRTGSMVEDKPASQRGKGIQPRNIGYMRKNYGTRPLHLRVADCFGLRRKFSLDFKEKEG